MMAHVCIGEVAAGGPEDCPWLHNELEASPGCGRPGVKTRAKTASRICCKQPKLEVIMYV